MGTLALFSFSPSYDYFRLADRAESDVVVDELISYSLQLACLCEDHTDISQLYLALSFTFLKYYISPGFLLHISFI
jgi:hypothetical protein